MTSVGPPEFDLGDTDVTLDVPAWGDVTASGRGSDGDSTGGSPGRIAVAAMSAVVTGAVVLLALALTGERPDTASETPDATVAPTTDAPATAVEPQNATPAPTPEPPYVRGLVDPVVAQITPHGNGYVGFVASTTPGRLAVVRSDDGLTWTRNNAVEVVGLPDGVDPLGMWTSSSGQLFLFGQVGFGADAGYVVGASLDHGSWWEVLFEVEPESGASMRPVFIEPGRAGVWVQLAEVDAEGRDVAHRSFIVDAFDLRTWREVSDAPDEIWSGTWTRSGFVLLTPEPADQPADPDWQWLTEYDVASQEFRPFTTVGLDGAVPLALLRMDRDLFVVDFGAASVYDTESDSWVVTGPAPIQFAGESLLEDIVTTPDGVAMLWLDLSQSVARGRYSVQLSNDLSRWKHVRITEEFITLDIKTIGDHEVVLEGVIEAAGPRRVRVPAESNP